MNVPILKPYNFCNHEPQMNETCTTKNGRGLEFHMIAARLRPNNATVVNETLPQHWIGCTGHEDLALHTWPQRSPDMTPCDFFLWRYLKERVYVLPLPADLDELTNRITAAVKSVTEYTLSFFFYNTIYSSKVHTLWQNFTLRSATCGYAPGVLCVWVFLHNSDIPWGGGGGALFAYTWGP
jgi:hypothetical protein